VRDDFRALTGREPAEQDAEEVRKILAGEEMEPPLA
jgi:hypothetical protein